MKQLTKENVRLRREMRRSLPFGPFGPLILPGSDHEGAAPGTRSHHGNHGNHGNHGTAEPNSMEKISLTR